MLLIWKFVFQKFTKADKLQLLSANMINQAINEEARFNLRLSGHVVTSFGIYLDVTILQGLPSVNLSEDRQKNNKKKVLYQYLC